MTRMQEGVVRKYDWMLEVKGSARERRGHYRKWLRFYLDFRRKCQYACGSRHSLSPFLEKLDWKNQTEQPRTKGADRRGKG